MAEIRAEDRGSMSADQLMRSALLDAQNPFLRERRGDKVEEELSSVVWQMGIKYGLMVVDYIYRLGLGRGREKERGEGERGEGEREGE